MDWIIDHVNSSWLFCNWFTLTLWIRFLRRRCLHIENHFLILTTSIQNYLSVQYRCKPKTHRQCYPESSRHRPCRICWKWPMCHNPHKSPNSNTSHNEQSYIVCSQSEKGNSCFISHNDGNGWSWHSLSIPPEHTSSTDCHWWGNSSGLHHKQSSWSGGDNPSNPRCHTARTDLKMHWGSSQGIHRTRNSEWDSGNQGNIRVSIVHTVRMHWGSNRWFRCTGHNC